jgi:pantothenate kinase-related protein Tda10
MANEHQLHRVGVVPRGTGFKHGLHGRAAESLELKKAIRRVLTPTAAAQEERRPELILVSGDSGTGKSSLARSLKDDISKVGAAYF